MEQSTALYESTRDNQRNIDFIITDGCGPHFHQHVEILCVKSGSVDVTVNDKSLSLAAGEVCVSDSFDIHSYAPAPGAVGYVLIVPQRYLLKYRTAAKEMTMASNVIRDGELCKNILNLLEMVRGQTGVGVSREEGLSGQLVGALAASVMGYISLGITYEKAPRGTSHLDLMRGVLSYLTEHFEEDVTLKDLSERFGYAPNHFSYLFNLFVHQGLKEYLNAIRVENAAELLKSGKSVTEAAFMSGFNSMRTFYRCFEEHFGKSPNRFIKA